MQRNYIPLEVQGSCKADSPQSAPAKHCLLPVGTSNISREARNANCLYGRFIIGSIIFESLCKPNTVTCGLLNACYIPGITRVHKDVNSALEGLII